MKSIRVKLNGKYYRWTPAILLKNIGTVLWRMLVVCFFIVITSEWNF